MGIVMVREVSPDELRGRVILAAWMEPIAWVAVFENEQIVGHGCISRLHGQCWLHDLAHTGTDKTAVARVYQMLRRLGRERGESVVFTDVESHRMAKLYLKRGFKPATVILKGTL